MQSVDASLSRPRFSCNWLFGFKQDLIIFFLPCLISISLLWASDTGLFFAFTWGFFTAEIAPLIGWFHGGSSWFHYLDEDNRGYFNETTKKFVIYFIMPAVIVLTSIALHFYFYVLIMVLYMMWTVQHLTQQNVGILLLYRSNSPTESNISRRFEARTIQLPAVLFGFTFLARNIYMLPDSSCTMLLAISVIVTTALSCVYLFLHIKQANEGKCINLSALAFWQLSVWFFLPLAVFGKTFAQAMVLPLMAHWCQYIGLNYILVSRKYEEKNHVKFFRSKPLIVYLVLCACFAIAIVMTEKFSNNAAIAAWIRQVLTGTVIGLSLVHYFQDFFIWRFREPFLRKALLVYLKQAKPAKV